MNQDDGRIILGGSFRSDISRDSLLKMDALIKTMCYNVHTFINVCHNVSGLIFSGWKQFLTVTIQKRKSCSDWVSDKSSGHKVEVLTEYFISVSESNKYPVSPKTRRQKNKL